MIKIIVTTLCIYLITASSLVRADESKQASIMATATVIPMLGMIPPNDELQALKVTKKYDSTIYIQAPKNAELYVSIENRVDEQHEHFVIDCKNSILLNHKNSVIDIMTIDLKKIRIQDEIPRVITITRIDN